MTDQTSARGNPGPTVARQPISPQQRQLQAFLRAPVPRIHANGLGLAANATDITVLLFDGEQLAGTLTLAYPTAKSLSIDLNDAITNFETMTGEKVRELKDLMEKMNAPQTGE
jgi:hypothetical protein